MKQPAAVILAAAIAATTGGCRNPFDPAAEIRVNRFRVQGDNYVGSITQTQAISYITNPTWGGRAVQSVRIVIDNLGTVPVVFDSYTVVYRQVGPQNSATCTLPPNSPICSLGGALGKRYHILTRMTGVTSSGQYQGYVQYEFPLRVITDDFLTYVDKAEPSDIKAGGVDCYVTVYGVDENGHDVKADGSVHLDVL